MNQYINKPTPAFIAVSWVALLAGAAAYCVGLFNAQILLNEKGYYLILILYGLFSAVSLQKVVRDKLEGQPVTAIYYGLCWASVVICIVLLALGLWNATMALSEKGFYIMAFLLSLFGAVAVQKNIRDLEYLRTNSQSELPQPHAVQQVEVKELETPEDKF
ncbi:YiaA/YiaB family protein [Acinetobacter sp. I-MWF]|uniref:inner membrane protein YiaA n=1 Tax=Acinetobacter TaxID=469 RepID=UPI0021C924AD|nr:inner membrane protein YiaA [Acinetobacter sp. I-MWF]MCT9979284.1 YiaA/YiaB family protein [Acinetobacter sp. I-MWF]